MAAKDYHLKDGTKVPGVTTVIGAQLAWNKGALMYWAWSQGRDGKDFRETKDVAADLGTLVHFWIEAEMRGKPTPTIPPEHKEKAENAMIGFYEWRDAFKLESTGSEVSLVSEWHAFGGTIDYPCLLNGRRVILDLKTSKDTYPDHRIQLAAYGQLWGENYDHPSDQIAGYHLLRVGKEDGGFAHHYWPSLSDEWEAFLLLLKLHGLQKKLK